jgi:hypothetical protein
MISPGYEAKHSFHSEVATAIKKEYEILEINVDRPDRNAGDYQRIRARVIKEKEAQHNMKVDETHLHAFGI